MQARAAIGSQIGRSAEGVGESLGTLASMLEAASARAAVCSVEVNEGINVAVGVVVAVILPSLMGDATALSP